MVANTQETDTDRCMDAFPNNGLYIYIYIYIYILLLCIYHENGHKNAQNAKLQCQGRSAYPFNITPGALTTTLCQHMKDRIFLPCIQVISEVIPQRRLFSKFHLENPRSRSWVRSKVKVTQRKPHVFDSYPFLFQVKQTIHSWILATLKFEPEYPKIQCKGHRWVQNSRSHDGSNIIIASISFHIPSIPEIQLFRNLTLKIKQGKPEGFYILDQPSDLGIGWKTLENNMAPLLLPATWGSWYLRPAQWPWHWMEDLGKQYNTSSILHEA